MLSPKHGVIRIVISTERVWFAGARPGAWTVGWCEGWIAGRRRSLMESARDARVATAPRQILSRHHWMSLFIVTRRFRNPIIYMGQHLQNSIRGLAILMLFRNIERIRSQFKIYFPQQICISMIGSNLYIRSISIFALYSICCI